MWESLIPNTTVSMDETTKDNWANMAVGTITSVDVVNYADFEWIVHTPDYQPSELFPPRDHTLGKAAGNYLVMKANEKRTVSDRALLVSDHYQLDPTRSFCFKLFYYIKNKPEAGMRGSKFEVFQSENYAKIMKIGEVLGSSSTTDWMQFNVTARAQNTTSINLWFYLV